MQCVILVGGLGTRLGGLTSACPKPMLDVAGRPFLERLIDNAARFGAKRFLLLAGYLSNVVREHFPCGVYAANGHTVYIDVVSEPQPLGTGGALRFAQDRLEPEFLMLNGDSLFSFNWLDLMTAPMPPGAIGWLARRQVDEAARYGLVHVGESERVISFAQNEHHVGYGEINGGVYRLRREIVRYIEGDNNFVSLEREVFPRVIAEGGLYSRLYQGFFIDIGVLADYSKAQDPKLYRRGAVFFDRDGVLNEDFGYVHSREQFRWMPKAREAIRLVNDLDMLAFVITNQAGVARGFYSEERVRLLHREMQQDLREIGAHVDDFRYCPHHPDVGLDDYRRACEWRKPGPGMVRDLCAHWPIELGKSLLIGDKDSDVDVAETLGIRGLKFGAGSATENLASIIAADLKNR